MRSTWVDQNRSADLASAGAPGLTAAVCVDEFGNVDYALLRQSMIGHGSLIPWCPGVAHEQTGPLPAAFLERLRRGAGW
jgi:hypothetical protein